MFSRPHGLLHNIQLIHLDQPAIHRPSRQYSREPHKTCIRPPPHDRRRILAQQIPDNIRRPLFSGLAPLEHVSAHRKLNRLPRRLVDGAHRQHGLCFLLSILVIQKIRQHGARLEIHNRDAERRELEPLRVRDDGHGSFGRIVRGHEGHANRAAGGGIMCDHAFGFDEEG